MRVQLAGTPAIVIPLFEKVLHSDIEVAGVITNPVNGVAYSASSDWSSKGTGL